MSAHRPQLRALESPELRVRVPEHVGNLLTEQLPEDQIWGLIPRSASVVLYGDSQAGKTFLALDLAACIATGREFDGRRVKMGAVLYVIAEGHAGFTKRIRALARKFPDLASAPFRVLRQAVDLRAWRKDLLARSREIEEDVGEIGAIIVDTLAQTIFGDENSSVDMADYIGAANWLAQEIGCPVIIVHHSGKDATRGMRGSSALRGNCDVIIHVKCDDAGNRTCTTDPSAGGKTRDGEPAMFGFRLTAVGVGRNRVGEEETSCVLAHHAGAAKQGKKTLSGSGQKLLVQLANDLAHASARRRDNGAPIFSVQDLLAVWAVTKKAAHQEKHAAPSYSMRALQSLIHGGWLAREGDDLWFV